MSRLTRVHKMAGRVFRSLLLLRAVGTPKRPLTFLAFARTEQISVALLLDSRNGLLADLRAASKGQGSVAVPRSSFKK